jgi:Ni/Co efflux regulator RcnB
MRSTLRPLAATGALIFLTSSLALAAPQAEHGGGPGQPAQQHGQPQGARANPSHAQEQDRNRSRDSREAHAGMQGGESSGERRGGPPSDFNQARQQISQHRDEIGRGPALPPNIHIAKGRPLPSGYGKRLPEPVLMQLPRYQGYEWRRVGSDMVLVALTTGIVYEILQGVLD